MSLPSLSISVGRSLALLFACLAAASGLAAGSKSRASAPTRPALNPVRSENALPGTQWWRLPQAPGRSIEGYASEVSAVPGDVVHLHISTVPAARYRVEVFRVGWYGGAGARLVACAPSCARDEQGTPQPEPPFDSTTGYVNAAWPVTDQIAVTDDWTSGYYLAELVLTSGPNAGEGGWVPLVVREPPSQNSAILVQAPVDTWQAYNDWGGRSLYYNHTGVGDNHVSFDRPYDPAGLPTAAGPTPLLNINLPQTLEFPLVRFLERGGYDVSYTTDVDLDRDPSELLRHRLVITAGHGEYWTKTIRDAFEQARDAGTNLAFLGANTGYWQIRYDDGRRTIVEYRKASADPEPDPALKTVRFRDLDPPRPECELLGVEFGQIGIRDYAVNPAALTDPWFSGTGFTAASTLPGLVGWEWDAITPGCQTSPLTDFFHYEGHQYVNADAVRYTAPSGARVFSTGTLRFSWGLDPAASTADPRLQLFMRNALDDLTRPAPPISLQAVWTRRGVRVRVLRRPDARVRGVAVYAHPGMRSFGLSTRGARLVCVTRGAPCVDRRALRQRSVRYAAVVLDPWGTSIPVLSPPIVTGRPV
jgi:hypothetical protein